MKVLRTSQGEDVQLDDDVAATFAGWTIYSHASAGAKHIRYAYVWVETRNGGENVPLHRLILGVQDKNTFVDHWDRNGLNNQRRNLRVATRAQNRANSRDTVGRCLPRGVYPRTLKSGAVRYHAKIREGTVLRSLGVFDDSESAARAYEAAAVGVFGQFSSYANPVCKYSLT